MLFFITNTACFGRFGYLAILGRSKTLTDDNLNSSGPKKNVSKRHSFFINGIQDVPTIRLGPCGCEKSLKNMFFQLGLDQLEAPSQKSIFNADFPP